MPPGALFVPIFIAVEGLSPHDAIPLSLATTLGGAAAAVLRDLTKPHPLRPHRKLLDFHTAALLAPPVAAGTVAGVYVNKILPPWMLTLLLTATLLFFAVKAAREGREILAPADPLAAAAGVVAGAADVEAPPATVGGTPLDSLVADELAALERAEPGVSPERTKRTICEPPSRRRWRVRMVSSMPPFATSTTECGASISGSCARAPRSQAAPCATSSSGSSSRTVGIRMVISSSGRLEPPM